MLVVTCAIIRNEEDEILVVQRGEATDHPNQWEFPGGKLAGNETDEECIIREVKEELSMEIVICGRLQDVIHDYGHKQIRLIPFICDTLDKLPFLSEHIAYKWLDKKDLLTLDYSEADIFVAKNYLEQFSTEKVAEKSSGKMPVEQFNDDAELQSMVNNMMSMKEAEWLATTAIENPAVFTKLFEFTKSSDRKLSFRASWTLTKVCDKFPELIYPYLQHMVDTLAEIDNESTLRSFLRIISLSDFDKISTRQHGLLADFCFSKLNSGLSAIAVKAYSLEIIYRLALIYPELANELSATINMLQGEGSAGIVARGRLVMKKLAEMPVKSKADKK